MSVRSHRATPILIAFAASATAIAAAALSGGDFVEQSRLAARWTARASFLIFLVAYSAAALDTLFPSALTRRIRQRRRQWGLGFALAHSIHFVALVHALTLTGEERPLFTLIGGGFAYALMLAMALTSNDASQRALGATWKRLHGFGIQYIWFIFFFSYAGRLADPERMATGLIFAPLAVAALGLRMLAWVKKRRARTMASAG